MSFQHKIHWRREMPVVAIAIIIILMIFLCVSLARMLRRENCLIHSIYTYIELLPMLFYDATHIFLAQFSQYIQFFAVINWKQKLYPLIVLLVVIAYITLQWLFNSCLLQEGWTKKNNKNSEKWEETMAVKHMKFVLENPSHLNEKLCVWKATTSTHIYRYEKKKS